MSNLLLPVTADTLAEAARMLGVYLGAMFLGAMLLPGIDREGHPQPNGERLPYKLTGMTLFFMTHVVVGVLVWGFGMSLTPLVTHFGSLLVVANLVAFVWLGALYLHGRRAGAYKVPHAAESGLPVLVKDLWFGNELNPRWLGVDLKMFLYQPSLIGVGLMVVAFAFAQHERHGTLTPQMLCFVAFWWVYLWTHYVKEEFMLSTWDVIAENLGFMLVWGDLVYVPFLYCLPGWWLVDATEPVAAWHWVSLGTAYFLCLWVFREANWQKERYKREPTRPIWGRPPETVGGKLLVSGWWGIGRKINYTGEIGVYLCFALTTGFEHWGPYVLPLSLLALLTQRAGRDDKKCRAKYGALWEAYCARARFRIIPFVY
jgi:delta14-sterol reductase